MDGHLDTQDKVHRFERTVLPHLDAAYSLARWLARDHQDAEDIVQMAFLRAFRFFDSFRGGNVRAWLLTIVRRTYYSWLRDRRPEDGDVGFDEMLHSGYSGHDSAASDPESIAAREDTRHAVNAALEKLPRAYREVVVLKDIENLSYKEIAEVVEIPIGTVMSRLARGRKLLGDYLRLSVVGASHEL